MKYSLLILISIFCVNLTFAQSQEHKGKEINFLKEKLSLNERQVNKVTKIIQRKHDNYQVIQKYKSTNPKKYASKLKALYEGTLISVELLLENDAQKEAYRQYRIELRKRKSEMMKKYKKNGLSAEDASAKYYGAVIFS